MTNYFLNFDDERLKIIKDKLESKKLKVFDFNNCDIKNIKSEDVIILSPAYKWNELLIETLPNNLTIFSGNISEQNLEIFKQKYINYFNYMDNEQFVLKNANLTAEGLLCEIIRVVKTSIFKLKFLILGGGRVSKAIGNIFEKLSLDYQVTTIDKRELSKSIFQDKYINWDSYKDKIHNYDVIINTIPANIFQTCDENKFKESCYIFEVSYKKCFENIQSKSINYIYVLLYLQDLHHFQQANLF